MMDFRLDGCDSGRASGDDHKIGLTDSGVPLALGVPPGTRAEAEECNQAGAIEREFDKKAQLPSNGQIDGTNRYISARVEAEAAGEAAGTGAGLSICLREFDLSAYSFCP